MISVSPSLLSVGLTYALRILFSCQAACPFAMARFAVVVVIQIVLRVEILGGFDLFAATRLKNMWIWFYGRVGKDSGFRVVV